MSRFFITILLFHLLHEIAFPQSSTYVDGGIKRTVSWDDLVGKIVTVDGLAWGAYEKGLGQHLVLPHGRVYIRDVDYLKHDLNGRLLRVSGYLRKSRVEKAPSKAQGYSESFDYFTIETFAAEGIDQIQHDQLLSSPFVWIVMGGKTDQALRSLNRLGYQDAGPLQESLREGLTSHAYRINEKEILSFYAMGGRITSLARVKTNDPRKRIDDERIPVKAYPLNPKK